MVNMVYTPEERLEKRRESVRKAVRKWRKTHPEKYNAYQRAYLTRPGPREAHRARCARYRKRRRATMIEGVDPYFTTPSRKIQKKAGVTAGMVHVASQLAEVPAQAH